VAFADRIILNKVDLATEDDLDAVEARMRALNPLAPIVRAERSNVPLDQVLGLGAFDLERILEVQPDFANPPHGADGHVHDEHCGHDHHHHDHDHGHDIRTATFPRRAFPRRRGHAHQDDIKGISLSLDRPLDGAKFTAWLDRLLGEQGQNILRAKGIIDVQGENRRWSSRPST
jgi:G3E family GTPase